MVKTGFWAKKFFSKKHPPLKKKISTKNFRKKNFLQKVLELANSCRKNIKKNLSKKVFRPLCLKVAKSDILWVKCNAFCHELYINTIWCEAPTPGELRFVTCTRLKMSSGRMPSNWYIRKIAPFLMLRLINFTENHHTSVDL